ncbi:MAG TPA: T9SS type A sorting domain-containing protein [Saprospiraceae bacterium]|nr:T9SS type A sorting domain-containing protein [Saprospiraceae bacterium]
MKKNQCIIWLFLILATGRMFAQELNPFVVSSSGGFYSNASGMLSFTIGEMTAVETYTSSAAILTQGFQQTFDFGTYITEHPNPHFAFGIYPNPSDGYFSLLTDSEANENVVVRISDVLGRVILRTEFDQQSNVHIQPFNLSDKTPGVYLISLSVQENNSGMENNFVSKIQIVR